jgi:hypothetical protein
MHAKWTCRNTSTTSIAERDMLGVDETEIELPSWI